MTQVSKQGSARIESAADDTTRFATLTFERSVAAPVSTLWEAWTAPAARAVWAAPTPSVTVEFLEADFAELGERSRLAVTVQLSSLAADMEGGYRQGFGPGMDNLAGVAERTMVLQRVIRAPRSVVWGAWMNNETLPLWWGPEGYSCRTSRIDLREGGAFSSRMEAKDGSMGFDFAGTYTKIVENKLIAYTFGDRTAGRRCEADGSGTGAVVDTLGAGVAEGSAATIAAGTENGAVGDTGPLNVPPRSLITANA